MHLTACFRRSNEGFTFLAGDAGGSAFSPANFKRGVSTFNSKLNCGQAHLVCKSYPFL